jgi:hypothetical protein
MKFLFSFLLSCFINSAASAQSTAKANVPDPNKKVQTAEASCGKCKFSLAGKSCDLAVRIDGKAYYVEGAGIDDFGDAHAHDGFCNAIRKAEVQGEVVGNKFKVSYFKLLPEPKKVEEKKDKDN